MSAMAKLLPAAVAPAKSPRLKHPLRGPSMAKVPSLLFDIELEVRHNSSLSAIHSMIRSPATQAQHAPTSLQPR